MTTAINPYGDGLASERIVEVLGNWRYGRPLLAHDRSFSLQLRPTTNPREPRNSLPVMPKDIGLLNDAMQGATDYKAASHWQTRG